MSGSGNRHTIVGNLVRWVKDTPVRQALSRSQFDLVMALCVEDKRYPSLPPIFRECVDNNINVSDIADFILWGAWLEDMKTTRTILQTVCALLENYKDTVLRVWPTATAGDTAYRAIMFTMRHKGYAIINNKLKYSMAMSAISNLSTELLGTVDNKTFPMFLNTTVTCFDVFATDVYMPHAIFKKKMYHHSEIRGIIREDVNISAELAALHTSVWGSNCYIDHCIEALKLIAKVDAANDHTSNVNINDLYVAGMAIARFFASQQMMLSAVPAGNPVKGYYHITRFLEEYTKERESENQKMAMKTHKEQEQEHNDNKQEQVEKTDADNTDNKTNNTN